MLADVRTALIATFSCVAVACAAARAADVGRPTVPPPTVVVLQAKEYEFVPSEVHFRHGEVYDLRLENVGKETHELTAPDFFKAARIETPDVLSGEGREILVQPGERKDLIFEAPPAGVYGMTCADHDWAGMVGKIIVD